MKLNRWIELSQRLYLQLLRLYPQAYRATYEAEMLRVFTDQCQEAYQQRGKFGILSLWPRILIDVGITAVLEHFTDPHARLGLLEVKPDAPLPWKGVLLVLIPGLIFFISQIAQLTSDEDWFFLAYYRAAYFLMLPVLFIWLLVRRFPVWGLIPFGLLYGTLASYSPSYLISKLPFLSDTVDTSYQLNPTVDPTYLIPVSGYVVLLGALIWYNARHRQIPHAAWKWLVFYILLIVFQILGGMYREVSWEAAWQGVNWQTAIDSDYVKYSLVQMPLWYLYSPLLFLLLIFIGVLFVRKYGGLSFLLLLGYLLPTIVFGRYGEGNDTLPFYLVSVTVLVYRFVVALVAPVWLVRAASIQGRQHAAAIPVAIAIICQISLNIIVFLVWENQYGFQINLLNFVLAICNQLIIATGLGLAVTLYLPKDQADISTPPFAVTT